MPDCGVHYLWFAFVCFLIRSPPPPGSRAHSAPSTQVTVDRPDVAGRAKILQVHARDKALAADVDLEVIARRTPGFTGADLQNVMNEAAIVAARRYKTAIDKTDVDDALEKIVAGAEKSGAVMSDLKRRLVAYHEAGHALVSPRSPPPPFSPGPPWGEGGNAEADVGPCGSARQRCASSSCGRFPQGAPGFHFWGGGG